MDKVIHKSPHWSRGVFYYFRVLMRKKPRVINLEFTKRCNARCEFCSCWEHEDHDELSSYEDIIKFFKPVVVSISGGEPLLRRDYARLISEIRPFCHYAVIITNGALLNEKSAFSLVKSGIDQICISLDYLSEEHDRARKINGLYAHLCETIPTLSSMGYRIVLNTVIMQNNLDQIIPIIHRAKEWNVCVSLSSYCALKQNRDAHMVDDINFKKLEGIIREIKSLKRKFRNIKNSDHYLDRITTYFKNGEMPNCKAGIRWIQISPNGMIQPCSELPAVCTFKEYSRRLFPTPSCTKCWYSCRGEAEANPLEPRRLLELAKS